MTDEVGEVLAKGRYRDAKRLIAKALRDGVIDGATHLRLLAWIDQPGTREALVMPAVGDEPFWRIDD